MQFTSEQQDAVYTHDQNLIVIAGAGSGKTRVLVERYLALLDQHPDWKITDLVAITFTEKAAREMRDRIRTTIQARIQTAATSGDMAAARRWRDHESLLDNARIGTIHSLCATLLRANPAETGIDPEFEVMDESEAAILKQDAVRQALIMMAEDEHPAAELLIDCTVYTVKNVLLDFVTRSRAEDFYDNLPDSEAEILAQWQQIYDQACQRWVDMLHQDQAWGEALDWEPAEGWSSDLDDKLMLQWSKVRLVQDDLESTEADIIRMAVEAIADVKLQGGSQKNWGSKEAVVECRAALRALRTLAETYLKAYPAPINLEDQHSEDKKAAHQLLLWKAAVQTAAAVYTRLKDDRPALDFDDLERLAVKLLKDHPRVAQRYAEREIKHVMVDEFQDTNASQREIIYRLCGIDPETLHEAPPGRLFVVGDPKQSIYQFRGADVSVFTQVRDEILQTGGERINLSRSFRTHETLVDSFNTIFSQIMQPGMNPYEIDYDQWMTAERPTAELHAHSIKIMPLVKPDDREMQKEDFYRWEAYEIGQQLRRMVEQQFPVWDKEQRAYRACHYGDVALLFRRMNIARNYENVFKGLGLPYITLGGRGYYDQQEVWDLINLLRALRNPADDLSLAAALRSPMFGLSDDGLLALRLRRAEPNGHGKSEPLRLWVALQDDQAPPLPDPDQAVVAFARDVLEQLKQVAGRMTVADLLGSILNLTAYDAILTALPDGDRRRENVEKLLRKARDSGRIGLGDFLLYLGDLKATEPREGEAVLESTNAIKLMTIHGSKGLEFPVVVVVDGNHYHHNANYAALKTDPDLGAACAAYQKGERYTEDYAFIYQQALQLDRQRDEAEHRRLFYVAATRAQDYLMITGKYSAKSESNGWMSQCLTALDLCDENGEIHTFQDQNVQIYQPITPPPDAILSAGSATQSNGWEQFTTAPSGQANIPPLLESLPPMPHAPTQHLSVSQLELLGSIYAYNPDESSGRQRFRQSVLHDAPAPIRPIRRGNRPPDLMHRRIIGDIVHKALQVDAWQRPNLDNILRAYAWKSRVTNPAEIDQIVAEAHRLLQMYQHNNPLQPGDHILREIPFVHRVGNRILHGIIDVLYRRGDQWTVLDYKTAPINAGRVEWHAQRYHLQVGAYASAVAERTGQIPQVQLYYISPGTLIGVHEKAWRHALSTLDQQIAGALD